MKYKLEVQPGAEEDTWRAYIWYEEQHEGLGEFFLKELEIFYKKLETTPEIFSSIIKQYRQAILKQFPYVIVYEISRTKVIVYAVFHTSRNPKNKIKKLK